ncbi:MULTISPECIES: tellurite resistance methyltransferase TehB [Erwinia]|uniref:Tellurite resistance methyltransferase TehB n=1 Tax=Erwinia pyrifoliae TaxID=79967 RepID=A0ABY5XAN2_ERWPY|nr:MULTISPECIES: tellurite resistance methyltransferase TehB [Erwinia]AUX74522.1 tellurite resistance methyltransferase TehB [Erwinia pyrifoliae]MCA8876332.1 tellurite resistance methyltransferase TehB [Erwinia pyrifoliae]MCT2386463.1 tellurite resistance methyltransferase TehB [Erwinia pyrifoliae]MCU8587940.1 tellurite resistance methyltransferase TehB [Erwinia pyrifoliae]UWS28340.1 tellurite resistance methyltransferase TehB [Erwinia pyrifoliae]
MTGNHTLTLMNPLTDGDFYKKYLPDAPHPELTEALPRIEGGRALDVGCGSGRNSLWLNSKGFDVTAWDNNPACLARLEQIITVGDLRGLHTARHDLNTLRFNGAYHLVLATAVMKFLQPATIPQLIADMQASTVRDGYNLIVSVMDSRDYPCREDFSFTFKSGELSHYYRKWHIVKYNEHVGQLQRSGENGQRIPLRFATLLAQKANVKA